MMLLLNPRSGAGLDSSAEAWLRTALPGAEIRRIEGSQLTAAAREGVARGERVVVAGGGDGAIGAVAAAVADSPATLGVLPLGTFNHFAKDLGIPLDLREAVRVLLAGRTVSIDAGDVNGRVFVNNASLGVYPRIVEGRRTLRRLGWNKWTAFAWAVAASLRRYPYLSVRVEAAGARVLRTTPFVFIGNNEYEVEGLRLGARARLDGGELWLYVAPHRASRWALMRLALRAILGRLRQERDFYAAPSAEIWVETRRKRIRVALDGELTVLESPLHFRVRRQALRVIAP